MSTIYKKGVSLSIVIITIVIITILSGAIILNITKSDTIGQASKVRFQGDIKTFETELELYINKETANNIRRFSPLRLNADENSVTYNGILDTSKTIRDIIPSLKNANEYSGKVEIVSGKLVYKGLDNNQKEWAEEVGVQVLDTIGINASIIALENQSVDPGTDVKYTVKISSSVAISVIDLENKLEVIKGNGATLSEQPNITIGTPTGIDSDNIRNVDITIDTSNLSFGQYKLRMQAGAAVDTNNSSTKEVVSSAFSINGQVNTG